MTYFWRQIWSLDTKCFIFSIFLRSDRVFEIISDIPFREYLKPSPARKVGQFQYLAFLLTYIDVVRTVTFSPPAEFWLVNSNSIAPVVCEACLSQWKLTAGKINGSYWDYLFKMPFLRSSFVRMNWNFHNSRLNGVHFDLTNAIRFRKKGGGGA